jgi:hypothetical protein
MFSLLLLLIIPLQEPVKQIPRGEGSTVSSQPVTQAPATRDNMSSVGFPSSYNSPSIRNYIPSGLVTNSVSLPNSWVRNPYSSFYSYNDYYNSMKLFYLFNRYYGFPPSYFDRYNRNNEPILNKDNVIYALKRVKAAALLIEDNISQLVVGTGDINILITNITNTIKRIKRDEFLPLIDVGIDSYPRSTPTLKVLYQKDPKKSLVQLSKDIIQRLDIITQNPETVTLYLYKTPTIIALVKEMDRSLKDLPK